MATRRTAGQGRLTRERLIDAAEEILLEAQNETAVSVRALERRAGVTAPTIYRYFPDMETLLAEVAARVFARLNATLDDAAGGDDPIVEVANLGVAFARFGLDHPNEYRVLFLNRAADEPRAAAQVLDAAGYRRLTETVRRVIAAGGLPADADPAEITSLLFMSLHGVVSLLIARPSADWGDPERLVGAMMQTIGYGLVPRTP